jgi:hypothetical protein
MHRPFLSKPSVALVAIAMLSSGMFAMMPRDNSGGEHYKAIRRRPKNKRRKK